MMDKDNAIEIDPVKLLKAYWHRLWLIALCGLVTGFAAFMITKTCVTPLYRSSVTVYVNNIRSDQVIDYVSGSNLQTAQRLVSTYVNIIRSDTVLGEVIRTGSLDTTPAAIRGCMSAAQVGETEMFTVSISHPDPEQAAFIANTIAQVAPSMISNFVEGSSTKVVDYAKPASVPFSPNYRKNISSGTMAGVVFALVLITLRFLFDTRIKSEGELRQLFDQIPVLGRIPAFSARPEESVYQSPEQDTQLGGTSHE